MPTAVIGRIACEHHRIAVFRQFDLCCEVRRRRRSQHERQDIAHIVERWLRKRTAVVPGNNHAIN
jgi:hypothetical protein